MRKEEVSEMEGELQKGMQQGEGASVLLLDLIPKKRDWMVRDGGGGGRNGYAIEEEKQLELRLGPPGGEDWSAKVKRDDLSTRSLGLFPKPSAGAKRGFLDTLEPEHEGYQQHKGGFLPYHASAGSGKEVTHTGDVSKVEHRQQIFHEKKASPTTPATGNAAAANNSSQTRMTTTTPVIGWPPIRSFRKNIATVSSKPTSSSQTDVAEKVQGPEHGTTSMLVKINMDGVPIGRKVDLKRYSSYKRLSTAVDNLFRGLLEAQRERPTDSEESLEITGLLDGSGEYTLVYEDNEGDRMLVGDVPWDMFVSAVKRLHVLKSSELPSLSLGVASNKRGT